MIFDIYPRDSFVTERNPLRNPYQTKIVQEKCSCDDCYRQKHQQALKKEQNRRYKKRIINTENRFPPAKKTSECQNNGYTKIPIHTNEPPTKKKSKKSTKPAKIPAEDDLPKLLSKVKIGNRNILEIDEDPILVELDFPENIQVSTELIADEEIVIQPDE